MRFSLFCLFAVFALLVSFTLAWVSNPAAGLTFNVYDLAEWTTLHPVVQTENPVLVTSALLRVPWLCTAVILGFSAQRFRWAYATGVIIVAVALLPPIEFVRFSDNINYRQQFGIAVLTLILGLIGVSGVLKRYAVWIIAVAALIGGIASAVGVSRALSLSAGFSISTTIGFGAIAAVIIFAVICVWAIATKIGQHSRPISITSMRQKQV
jgi:hypothetical protein